MKKKKLLGYDLGVGSIGWALIESENDTPSSILGMGVRIIPLSPDDKTEFEQGNAISKNQKRTLSRTQRRGMDRYQLRRKALTSVLKEKGMYPNKLLLLKLSPLEIWGLRAKAVKEKVSLEELGRIWLHLNQRRGYKHSKTDNTEDSKQTEYVQAVNNRYALIKANEQTIGEHFYSELKAYFNQQQRTDAAFRIKEKVFPRGAYEEEFDIIWQKQKEFYPNLLTEDFFEKVKNEIIYYQRKLKSQKGLVNVCEFEGRDFIKNSKPIFIGPKVAPKSSPLFQVEKIWESINNIVIKNKKGKTFEISNEKKKQLFDYLNKSEKLTQTELFKILELNKTEGYFTNTLIRSKGIQGNTTIAELIKKGIEKDHYSLQFQLNYCNYVDKQTGEIIEGKMICPEFEHEPLYCLWHCIYSLEEKDCIKKLIDEFGFDESLAKKLSEIDFTKGGFGNKSARAIRKILPHLQDGLMYDKACLKAGYGSHSDSLTKDENLSRQLLNQLSLLPKNSLRQPVVEKILNQLINTTNAIIEKYGRPDSIRIELSRELNQSREERNNAYKSNNKREKENKAIEQILLEHPHFKKKNVSKNDKIRYRLWKEFGEISPYEPGKIISLAELFSNEYDIEHIIPRSVRFDDSYSNKTLCPRRLNSGQYAKNAFTAFDYMHDKRSKEDFETYLAFIEDAYANKQISKTKYTNLLTQANGLTSDFINRSLNETRYISRKAVELLSQICYEVNVTSGAITQRLRDLWGWDKALQHINFEKFKAVGQTKVISITHNEQTHDEEIIDGWSKRDDHRHHAIDALVVACTKQGFIQRINHLNTQKNRNEMLNEISNYKEKFSLLDNYLLHYKPFETSEIVATTENIIISYKPGKKVATFSSRKININGKKHTKQRNIVTPRGALSEESVYGKIKRRIIKKVKLDKNFTDVSNIINPLLKSAILQRLTEYDNDANKAFGNLKKQPLWLDADKKIAVSHVEISSFTEEYVIKYPITQIKEKDLPFIVDTAVREKIAERLKQYHNNEKEAYKNLEESPIWLNEDLKIPIKSVRCYTGLSKDSVVPIKVYDATWDIEYEKYVKPGSNHHIAIYRDTEGNLQEHIVSFWHAVERKKYGLPVIIKKPSELWSHILNQRDLPQFFLDKLPHDQWTFITSLQQNESFVFYMDRDELKKAIENKAFNRIGPNIFRVRKITKGNYWFNQQYETQPKESVADKKAKRCIQASLSSMTGIKIKINNLGEIFIAD